MIQRNPVIRFNTVSGQTELDSPYLRDKGKGIRPLADEMKIARNGRSEAVNRAMSDFGSEESFENAARRFKEHYKYECPCGTVSRITKEVAGEASEYVEKRLSEAGDSYGDIPETGRSQEKIPAEPDGCELGTAVPKQSENSGQTAPVHNNPKKKKIINWREVRTGLTRPSDSVSEIYIVKTDTYPGGCQTVV